MPTTTTARSSERTEFLTDLLTTAIENFGYGWFTVDEYEWENPPAGGAYAVVTDEDEGETHRIDLDVIVRGLRVIRDATTQVDPRQPNDGPVLHNDRNGFRLFVSPAQRRNIMLADRTNGDEGDLDCIDALAVVECGLFGRVVYA